MIDPSRIARFIAAGASTAAVQLGLFWSLTAGLDWPIVPASTIALVLAGLYNYTLHYYWTFPNEIPHGAAMARYLLMCLGALLLNGLVMYLGVSLLHIHYFTVQLAAGTAVVMWSFGVSSLWVFAKRH